MNHKRALRKIGSGKLDVIAHWEIPETLQIEHKEKGKRTIFIEALTGALVMPVIFLLIGLSSLLFKGDLEFLVMMLKFGVLFFLLIYPFSIWGQWRKGRLLNYGKEVYFGNNWFLRGKIFIKWNFFNDFKGCHLNQDESFALLIISTKGIGRGSITQNFEIPVPEENLEQAKELCQLYNNAR